MWKIRGFKKTDGSPIQHHAQVMKLLHAMMKPKEIATAMCAADKMDMSRAMQGNKGLMRLQKQLQEQTDWAKFFWSLMRWTWKIKLR